MNVRSTIVEAKYPARSVIVVMALDLFQLLLLGKFAMTRLIAPAGIVGMSLAVDLVSLVSRRPAADSAEICHRFCGDIEWQPRGGGEIASWPR